MAGNASKADQDDYTLEMRMEIFDSFPFEIREAYRYAAEDYCIRQVHLALLRGYHDVGYVVKALKGEL